MDRRMTIARLLVLSLLGLLLVTLTSGVLRAIGVIVLALAVIAFTAATVSERRAAEQRRAFQEPGDQRVVLQTTGARAVEVIRELRRTTGITLLDARTMVQEAPVVVAEGLSEQSAERVADRLRSAGARATAVPADGG